MSIKIMTDRAVHDGLHRDQLNVGTIGRHDSLFKYVSLDGKRSWNYLEQTIARREVIGATLNSLNDPFEGKARLFDDLESGVINQCCNYFDKNGMRRNARDDRKIKSDADIKALVDKSIETFLENARILSFSRRPDSPLLWSHYANSHRGACLHFSNNAFEIANLAKGSVNYTRYRPVVPLSLPAKIALPLAKEHHLEDRLRLREELYKTMFLTKPEDWSYEEEVRLIYSSARMTNVPVRKAGLFEIILGLRMPVDDRRRIEELVRKHDKRIKIRRAIIDKDTFSVGID